MKYSKFSVIKQLLSLLREKKKLFLAPLVLLLLGLGILMVFAEGSALAPFIYAIF